MIEKPEIQPSLTHTLSIWWLVMWRATAAAMLLAIVFGFSLGAIGHGLGWQPPNVVPFIQVGSVVIAVSTNIYVLQSALRKQYKGFRIALIPAQQAA